MFFGYKTATFGYGHCYRFSASQPKNGNVVDAESPASAPIADAGKTAPAPGAGAVFLGAGCRSLPMPRFGTVSGNGIQHRWKRANPSLQCPARLGTHTIAYDARFRTPEALTFTPPARPCAPLATLPSKERDLHVHPCDARLIGSPTRPFSALARPSTPSVEGPRSSPTSSSRPTHADHPCHIRTIFIVTTDRARAPQVSFDPSF